MRFPSSEPFTSEVQRDLEGAPGFHDGAPGQLQGDPPAFLLRLGGGFNLADTVLFLASDQAGWITGQVLVVHGGHRMSQGL